MIGGTGLDRVEFWHGGGKSGRQNLAHHMGQGIAPPPEFSRPEVARILMDYYQRLDRGEA